MSKLFTVVTLVGLAIVGTLLAMNGCSVRADDNDNDNDKRYSTKDFSFQPPKGWSMTEIPGLKFKAAMGPAANGFAPNIIFVDEVFDGTLADYAAGNKKALEKVFKNQKVLAEKSIKTATGAAVIVLAIERQESGKTLKQTLFFLDLSDDRKMTVTCTVLRAGGDKRDASFEEAIKSIKTP